MITNNGPGTAAFHACCGSPAGLCRCLDASESGQRWRNIEYLARQAEEEERAAAPLAPPCVVAGQATLPTPYGEANCADLLPLLDVLPLPGPAVANAKDGVLRSKASAAASKAREQVAQQQAAQSEPYWRRQQRQHDKRQARKGPVGNGGDECLTHPML